MKQLYSFHKLEVYNDARELVRIVYPLIDYFPAKERYILSSQIQRAVISVVSNIAEGTSRSSYKEKERFIEISYGSLVETYCQLEIASDLKYITSEQLEQVQLQVNKIANKLSALKKSYQKHIDINNI